MSTRPRQSARTERQRQERRRRLAWVGGTAAVVLAVASVIIWTVAGSDDQPDATVEGFTHVHGLEVAPWDAQAVYLSTHYGLFRIEDGQWSEVSEEPHDFMGFAAHPSETGVLYSSGHPADGSAVRNPVGFMVSTDGGASWDVRSLEGLVDFHAMTVGAGGEVIYGWNVSGDVGLYRSLDDGHSWETVDAPRLHAAGGALSLAAHPADPDHVWAGTPEGLFHSPDAGASWEPVVSDVPVTAVAVDPADADRVLAYAPAQDGGLIESTDAGQSWAPTSWLLADADDAVAHIAIHPSDPQRLYAGTYVEDLYRSTDGGRTWEAVATAGEPE